MWLVETIDVPTISFLALIHSEAVLEPLFSVIDPLSGVKTLQQNSTSTLDGTVHSTSTLQCDLNIK